MKNISNNKYQLLKETQHLAKIGFLDLDLNTGNIELSDEIYYLYDIPKKDTISNEFLLSFVHPDDIDFVNKRLDLAIKGVKDYDIEHRIVRSDGKIIWVHSFAKLSYDQNNNPQKLLGVSQEITKKKLLELELKENEEKFKNLYDSILDAILIADTNRNIIDCNPAFKTLFGYSKDEILGKKTRYIYENEEQFIELGNAIKEHYDGVTPFVYTVNYKKKNGEIFSGATSVFYLKNNNEEITGFIGLVRDVSEKLTAEREIRELSQVIKTSPQMVVVSDIEGKINFVNDALIERGKYLREEVIGKQLFDFTDSEGVKLLSETIIPALFSKNIWRGEINVSEKSGKYLPAYLNCSLLTNNNGEPENFVAVFDDITERKMIENLLVESEKKFSDLINLSPIAMFIHQGEKFIFINKSFEQQTGYSKEELLEMNFLSLVHHEDQGLVQARALKRLKHEDVPQRYEFKIIDKKGKIKWVDFYGRNNDFNTQPSILGYAYDITERKNSEIALKESEEKFRILVEQMNDGIIQVDLEDVIRFVNPRFCQLLGYSEDELIGKTGYKILLFNEDIGLIKEKSRNRKANHFEQYELRMKKKNGDIIYFLMSRSPISNTNREVVGSISICTDITDRINSKILLEKSNSNMINILERMTDGFVALDKNWIYTYVNNKAGEMFGRKPEELIGKHIWTEFPEGIGQPFYKNYYKAVETQKVIEFEDYYVPWDKWYKNRVIPSESGIDIYFQDITEQILNEKKIIESEKKYKEVIETATEVIYTTDINGNYLYINPAGLRITGYSLEELLNSNYLDFILPEYRSKVKRFYFKQYLGKKKSTYIEYPYFKKNRETGWFGQNGTLLIDSGKVIGFQFIARDITDRRLAEERLKESEESYRNLFNNAQVGLFRTSIKDGQILECNLQLAKMFGYDSRKEIISEYKTSDNYVDSGTEAKMLKMITQNGFIENFETRFYRKDNSIFWAMYSAQIYPEKGWIEGVAVDVTERKAIEESLILNEKKFRNFFEDDISGNFISSIDGKLLDCNQSFLNIFNFKNKEHALNTNMYNLYPDRQIRLKKINLLKTQGKLINYQESMLKISGEKIITISNIIAERDSNGNLVGFKGYLMDVTEQKKAEEELTKLAKLQSLGILAGGIAHNFKNILAGISLNIGLIKIKPSNSNKYVDNVEKAIDQATVLADRFQTFSSGGEPVKEIISIKNVIKDAVNMALSGTKVKGDLHFASDLWNIRADSKQLNEVFNNLFINANDAMPKGGYVSVKVENYIKTESDKNLKEGIYIKTSVKDEGVGIPKKIINNIFDPFFSTKSQGRGLGLSSIYYIIQKHNGWINVSSEVGKGTQFDIYLPATESIVEMKKEDEIQLVSGANKRILYMDDEEVLRENMTSIFELLDYEIDTAEDGYKAISLFKDSIDKNNKYDAVILDLTIQGSDLQGEDVLKELMKIDKSVKAIVFSGHSVLPIVANYKDYGFVGRLEKPVSIEKISRVIDEVTSK